MTALDVDTSSLNGDSAQLTASLMALAEVVASEAETQGRALRDTAMGQLAGAVAGTRWTTVSIRRSAGRPATFAASDRLGADVDALQRDAGEGPCLDALDGAHVVRSKDIRADTRWLTLASMAPERSPVRAVLSVPVSSGSQSRATLNLYADHQGAYAATPDGAARLAAAAASLALVALQEQEQVDNLNQALMSNRQIGAAIGVLMTHLRCSYDEAFASLRLTSQNTHRKLRDVADEVLFTGTLPECPQPHRIPAEG